jgi:ankyrin repeat protein
MPSTNKFFTTGPQAALEIAIRANDASAMGRALAEGAEANARGKLEITPLMIAVDAQSPDAVNALLKAGAAPNAQAVDRNGPVTLAVQSYRAMPYGRDIMMAVFKAGGDPDSRRPDGDPVIFRFIEDHDADDIKLMKALGANLDIRDRGNDPLITSVAMAQDWDMVWALIEMGAKYDYENGGSRRPISMALSLTYPARDSPLYPYKLKVWQLLKDKGLPVKPMRP